MRVFVTVAIVVNDSNEFQFIVSLYNYYFRLVYRHTTYPSSAQRKRQSKEINSKERNENMHSDSERAKFVNRISCFMKKYPRKKVKI